MAKTKIPKGVEIHSVQQLEDILGSALDHLSSMHNKILDLETKVFYLETRSFPSAGVSPVPPSGVRHSGTGASLSRTGTEAGRDHPVTTSRIPTLLRVGSNN